LWKNQWSDGISEGSFTQKEILEQFTENGITIPEPLMRDFDNTILKNIKKRMDLI
jgi:hypothetical protein